MLLVRKQCFFTPSYWLEFLSEGLIVSTLGELGEPEKLIDSINIHNEL